MSIIAKRYCGSDVQYCISVENSHVPKIVRAVSPPMSVMRSFFPIQFSLRLFEKASSVSMMGMVMLKTAWYMVSISAQTQFMSSHRP